MDEILFVAIFLGLATCLLIKTFCSKVKDQGLYLVTWRMNFECDERAVRWYSRVELFLIKFELKEVTLLFMSGFFFEHFFGGRARRKPPVHWVFRQNSLSFFQKFLEFFQKFLEVFKHYLSFKSLAWVFANLQLFFMKFSFYYHMESMVFQQFPLKLSL